MLESGVSLFCGFRSSDSWPWWSGPWSGSWQPRPEKNPKRWSEEIRSDFSGSEFREMAPHERILFIPVSQNRMSGSVLARENRFIIDIRKCNFWFSLVNQKLDVLVILIIQKPLEIKNWISGLILLKQTWIFWTPMSSFSLVNQKPDIQIILVITKLLFQFIWTIRKGYQVYSDEIQARYSVCSGLP